MAQETQIGALYQPRGGYGEGDAREVQKGGDVRIPIHVDALTENNKIL